LEESSEEAFRTREVNMFKLMMFKVGVLFAVVVSIILFGMIATGIHNFFVEFFYGDFGFVNWSSRYLSHGISSWVISDLAPIFFSDIWYGIRVFLQVVLIPMFIIDAGKWAYMERLDDA